MCATPPTPGYVPHSKPFVSCYRKLDNSLMFVSGTVGLTLQTPTAVEVKRGDTVLTDRRVIVKPPIVKHG